MESLFRKAVSDARFGRYLLACNSNELKAKHLYFANLLLSQKLYAVVGMLEVVLRNAINEHYKVQKGKQWLADAVNENGFMNVRNCRDAFQAIQKAINELNDSYTHDRLVAKLTFGFWTYQFAEKEFSSGGSTLLNIFSNKPTGLHQKKVFKSLFTINVLRNRIAHYEPICFEPGKSSVSTQSVERRFDTIRNLFAWLGYNPSELMNIDFSIYQEMYLIKGIVTI